MRCWNGSRHARKGEREKGKNRDILRIPRRYDGRTSVYTGIRYPGWVVFWASTSCFLLMAALFYIHRDSLFCNFRPWFPDGSWDGGKWRAASKLFRLFGSAGIFLSFKKYKIDKSMGWCIDNGIIFGRFNVANIFAIGERYLIVKW